MAALNENSIALLNTGGTTIADLSSTGATTLYTVPTGKVCIPVMAWLKVEGDVGAALVCSIGRSTALTDFVGATNGDNLDADEDAILMMPVPSATPATNKTYAAAVIIQFNVSVAGNAVAGKVWLFGFLFDA